MSPFVTLVAAGLLARLGYQMARSPVLPRFAQDLGAMPELIGLIVAASTITGVAIKLPAGALSDVLGRRRMLILGTCFFAFPPFLYLFVGDPVQLLLLRFLHGTATAIFSPVASAFVADLFQQGRGEKLGWFASANDVGATLGPLLGGLVLFYVASYEIAYLLVGALGLLPLFMVLRLPGDARAAATGEKRWQKFRQGILEVASSRPVLIASAMEAFMYLGYGALLGFLPLYGRDIGLNDAAIGIILGTQLATTMLAKPLSGRLSDRLGRKTPILAGLLVCSAALPLIVLTSSFVVLIVLSALFGLGVATVTPSTTALIADLAKAGRMGSAMGVFGSIWDSGEASGPILAGILIGSLSYLPAFGLIAVLMVAAAVLFQLTVTEPGQVAPTQAVT
ncbi:MAG: MFS transporter [Chloroflexi bacterium]|nr:MFS transporter [Chloroflexota bacterium]